MTSKVFLTRDAKGDVAQAAAWYRDRSPDAANAFLLAVSVALARIQIHPTAHAVVDAATGTRRGLLRKFPQRVLYLIDGKRAIVFAITHHRRDDAAWLERLQ